MDIKITKFLTSSAKYQQCPPPDKPELAFIGRSNVGKSSLINMITGRKGLAKVSGRPGKTQLINHFDVDDQWYLVDLPGYGYAKVSQKKRADFQGMIYNYLLNRENLALLNILVDSRLEPQTNDLEFISWAGENMIPLAIILTKSDKLSKNQAQSAVARWRKQLKHQWVEVPPLLISSAASGQGRDEILDLIDFTIQNYNNQ